MGERPLIARPPVSPGGFQLPNEPPDRPIGRDWFSDAFDAIAGATGLQNPLDPQASRATQIGGLVSGGLATAAPMLGMARAASGAPRVSLGDLPTFASLAETLEPSSTAGVYRLKPGAIARLERFHALGADIPRSANWSGVTKELTDAFGGDKAAAEQWSRLWGATSPNTSVPRNTGESVSAQLYGLEHPNQALTLDEARALSPNITMAGSKVPNINRAFAGEPLSGDKVEAMAQFMVGRPRIPIDVHAMYGVAGTAKKLDEELPALRSLMTRGACRTRRSTRATNGHLRSRCRRSRRRRA
jgi:hypothetical protein